MSARAPDGKPWPVPRVCVDTSEQTPLAFGHVPAAWEPNAPVHHGQVDHRKLGDPLFAALGRRFHVPYPWHCSRANLQEGDYQLQDVRTGAPLANFAAIETKRGDLVSSLTWGHERLEDEFRRLRAYRFRALVAAVSVECVAGMNTVEEMAERIADALAEDADGAVPEETRAGWVRAAAAALGASLPRPLQQPRGAEGKEASLIGSILSLGWDNAVPVHMMPNPSRAEYMVAFLLQRAWKVALTENPPLLAEVRRLEAIDRAHGRPVPAVKVPVPRVPIAHPAEQYRVGEPGFGRGKRRAG